jgi:hypothetical protein
MPAASAAGGGIRRPRGERAGRDDAAERDRGRPTASAADGAEQGKSREAGGGAAAAAGRALHGGKDGRLSDDSLWARAASQHAAGEARRQARGPGTPHAAGSGRREPYRPWFTASAEEDLWLNADGTGEPWYVGDGEDWL